jgi:glycosyltransferase involved in cell wall biosynthesis
MKIILLITGLGMGGAEKVVTSLADAMANKSHEVLVVYMTGSAAVRPTHSSIRVINLGMESKKDAFLAFFKLRRLVREFDPDVVHSHMIHANLMARVLRLTIPITRLISTAHSSNEGGKLRMLAYRMTDTLADISTNVSEEAAAAYIKAKAVRPGRMLAVHNGIDTNVFAFNPAARIRVRQSLMLVEESVLMLAAGRFHEAKDYPNLLNALTELPVENINFQLCIAGDGPLRKDLEKLVAQLGLSGRVQFLGIRHDIADLMSAADIFVLPSAWEGFGLVVAEAMACERVVVATDCGGVREVVGEAGYLVKPKNSRALAQKLHFAMNLPIALRATLGQAARQRIICNYGMDVAVEKWLKIYDGKNLH